MQVEPGGGGRGLHGARHPVPAHALLPAPHLLTLPGASEPPAQSNYHNKIQFNSLSYQKADMLLVAKSLKSKTKTDDAAMTVKTLTIYNIISKKNCFIHVTLAHGEEKLPMKRLHRSRKILPFCSIGWLLEQIK